MSTGDILQSNIKIFSEQTDKDMGCVCSNENLTEDDISDDGETDASEPTSRKQSNKSRSFR